MIKDNPLFKDVSVDPRLIGLEILMSPYADKTSSQRLSMASSQLNQAMVLDGGEHPRVMSGFESKIGEYEFDTTKRDSDAIIIKVINKYLPGYAGGNIVENPTQTVVYLNVDTNVVHYFNRNTYTQCAKGFGYRNVWLNSHYLTPGNYLPKDVKLCTSPIHDGNKYGLGVNLNTAFVSLNGVTQDAFLITESAANKMMSTIINSITLDIAEKTIPLNKYGDLETYKFFADIGCSVPDGVLMWFRELNSNNLISDFTDPISLTKPQYLHDEPIVISTNAVILDVDFHVNKSALKIIEKNGIYRQVGEYVEQKIEYYKGIVNAYQEIQKDNFKISHEFNTLVTEAYAYLLANSTEPISFGTHTKAKTKDAIVLTKKSIPIEFITMDIVYEAKYHISAGYKFSGRDGSKGVCGGSVIRDEDTLVDEYGIKADFIQDAVPAVFNRMNSGQLYEAFYNRTGEFVRRRVEKLLNGEMPEGIDTTHEWFSGLVPGRDGAWRYLTEFYQRACNQMYQIIMKTCKDRETEDKFLESAIKEGLYFLNIPYTDIPTETVLKISELYPAPLGRATFTVTSTHGEKKKVTTVDPVNIGSKYIYLLCKIPLVTAPAVGHINQHKIPIVPSPFQRIKYPISQTVIRLGEDEVRNITMVAGGKCAARILGLYANSDKALDILVEKLLTDPNPSKIKRIDMTTDDIIASNNVVNITQHMFSTFGVDITKKIDQEDVVRLMESQVGVDLVDVEWKVKENIDEND